MEKTDRWSLGTLCPSLKVLVTCFILTLMAGYAVALLQVNERTRFDLAQTLLHYRGAEEGGIHLPQSFGTLLSVSHVHTFSQPVMLVLVGLLFSLSRVTEKAKVIFILLSFAGSVLSNAAPWLIRYTDPRPAVLLPVSQMALFISFFVMAFVVLRDTWRRKGEGEEDE